MKKALLVIICMFLCLSVAFSEVIVTEKAITAVFTAKNTCFAGFSRKNVTNAIQLNETEEYKTGEAIKFKYDPINNYYYTELFYAYCQGFSSKPISVTVSAPATMACDDSKVPSIEYELIYNADPSNPELSKEWGSVDSAGNYSVTITETGAKFSKGRAVMSQPIKLKVRAQDVKPKNRYTVTFTMKVSVS